MELIKHKVGEFIELLSETNTDLLYGIDDVRGVNNLKQLMATKADLTSRDLTKFQIVRPGNFVFNHRTSRNGDKFSIAYNDGDNPVICTEDYVVFKVKEERKTVISEEWLFLYFNRPEFDRYVITNSWGSSTEFFNWEDICDVEIELPPYHIQKKYVAVYKSMLQNQRNYEMGLDDLKLTFDALIDKYKHSASKKTVGCIVQELDNRNADGSVNEVQGINIKKQFMPSIVDVADDNLKKYKIVRNGQFAYSGMQTGRDECIRIALYNGDVPILISPAYTVLEIKDREVLAEYFMMWFSRTESDRLGWFMSDSSIRANLDLERFFEIKIPVPEINIQTAIVDIYNAFRKRREINERLKAQIKDLCPILIKGSIEEARK